MEEADEASRNLGRQIERARKVLREYRQALGTPFSNNDNSPQA